MAKVKGSKQRQMVVVPHRPWLKFGLSLGLAAIVVGFGYLSFEYGKRLGLAFKVEVVKEKQEIAQELSRAQQEVADMRQQIASLRLGGQIDSQATEEVRSTVEQLEQQIVELNEEIRFYKGVMLPNVENKGLRIERLDMVSTGDPNKYRYSLLLTQVVDKHEFVQGGVKLAVRGRDGVATRELSLQELDEQNQDAIQFRFRYFQNLDGELSVPSGFEPEEIMVIAQSSGRNGQRLEKTFNWQVSGG